MNELTQPNRLTSLGSDLWIQLGLSDSGCVEVYKTKEDEEVAAELRAAGLITGKRWAKLTPLGVRVLNHTSA